MLKRMVFLNPILAWFGWEIVQLHIGHWYVVNGKLRRASFPSGDWKMAKKIEGLPDNATGLERFSAENRAAIDMRKEAMRGR